MNRKEIKFYLKFHKEFRKNHTLNSALKMNSSRWNSFECRINMKNIILFIPILLMLFSCGPSVKEKEEIAVLTCNIMGESRNMDAAFRIKEINGAREQIGEDRFLGTDDEILESFELGLCNELVLNDKEYEVKLNNALFGVGLTSSLNGKVVSYYENGQLRERANFKDGKEEGFWEEYYENGQLKSKVNYQEGKKVGFWEEYYENGQLKKKVNNKDGKEEGYRED